MYVTVSCQPRPSSQEPNAQKVNGQRCQSKTKEISMPLSFPQNPQQNDTYTYNNKVYVYVGNTWGTSTTAIADVSATTPTIVESGYLWYDTANEQFFIYVNGDWIVSGGGASIEPASTAPEDPDEGNLWLDTNTGIVSVYYGGGWVSVSGGDVDFANITTNIATSGTVKANTPFFLNANEITASYTVPSNTNAMSAGPVEIGTNVIVTVSNGSEWSIV